MKERPVIFNGEMVRAILDGRKTQTRRAISDRHLHLIDVASQVGECYPLESGIDHANSQSYYREYCPFGQVGDRLWVRETFGDCGNRLVYRADTEDGAASQVKRWVPSIHMPREACRILLEITTVRVERLNDISDGDAIREGCSAAAMRSGDCVADVFACLWSSIYGADSWRANPWVWVIEFRRVGGA
ncbi:morphogenetic protein [uncultured Serratia sp.]|uniref:morphogenetic protein n=1 Tax=uncultured Serratia sp. TaxID=239175 RepID=UPI00258833E3|nr:morphogenetic protein [uncultured Serratia sp.]